MEVQVQGLNPGVIAVSISDANKFGCPHCGSIFGSSPMSAGGSQMWRCSDCNNISIYVNDGMHKSSIAIGDVSPEVVQHPRSDKPVNRDKFIAERKERIHSNAYSELTRWLILGHERALHLSLEGSHTSKSSELPIIRSTSDSNVDVSWFAYNYYNHFMAMWLTLPVAAPLLYPIAGMFGHQAQSGHENAHLGPDVWPLEKMQHGWEPPIYKFGVVGDGIGCALALRYVEEISKIDSLLIRRVCLEETRYGKLDHIDGSAIDFKKLLDLFGIEGGKLYKEKITNAPNSVFEDLSIDWFATKSGTSAGNRSAVTMKLREGVILPPLPLPCDISLDIKDTALSGLVPKEVMKRVPLERLEYRHDRSQLRLDFFNNAPYQPHQVYNVANVDAREFTFHTTNVLNSALVAFFFMKVLPPVLERHLRILSSKL